MNGNWRLSLCFLEGDDGDVGMYIMESDTGTTSVWDNGSGVGEAGLGPGRF